MKKVVIIVILLGVIYVFGLRVKDQIEVYINDASLIASTGMRGEALRDLVRTHYNEHVLTHGEMMDEDVRFDIRAVHINEDTAADVVATAHDPSVCGSGGCITTIFIQNDDGDLEPIPFAYAVKTIEVESTITNGMHDLRINDNARERMQWDGARYVLTQL